MLFNVSLLDALHFLKKSWDNVSEETIINCFRKAKFCYEEGPQDDIPEVELESFDDDDLPTCAEFNEDSRNEADEKNENEKTTDDNIELYSNITC